MVSEIKEGEFYSSLFYGFYASSRKSTSEIVFINTGNEITNPVSYIVSLSKKYSGICLFLPSLKKDLYKDIKERSKAKQYLEEALEHYSKAISLAPSQEEVEKLELDRDLDLTSPADVYRARGDVYSWMNNKWKKACSDWKVAKKLGDEVARDNFRYFKC